VLVIDDVELVALDQPVNGNSIVMTPSGLSTIFMPATKSLRHGTWARTLLPRSKSACPNSSAMSRAASRPEKAYDGWNPFFHGDFRYVGRRLDAEHRMPGRMKCWSR
jgi:hypothetical protein